jgi:hypothetical protein
LQFRSTGTERVAEASSAAPEDEGAVHEQLERAPEVDIAVSADRPSITFTEMNEAPCDRGAS